MPARKIFVVLPIVACAGLALAEPRPTETFSENNPDCVAWTDGCIVCAKQLDGTDACSTPGVACERSEARCVKKVDEPSSHK
jgi:hypothetical protein